MKIIIPNYCPPDSFVDNVSYTLKKMGYEVVTMPAISNQWMNSPLKRALNKFQQKFNSKYISTQEVWLLKTIRSFKPDIVLTLTQALSESTLFELKRREIKTAVWWGDPPANMKSYGLLCDGWDAIFIKDPKAVNKLNRVGIYAELLHEAMNPDWHKPISTQKNEHIIIAGTFYNYRHYFTRKLLAHNIKVEMYGQLPPIWADRKIRELHSRKFVTKEEKSRVFAEGLACLNTTSMAEGNSLNCRAFEIAGARGLQLFEYRPIVSECFEPGKEILTFDTFDELLEMINKVKKQPEYAEKIREAGYQRALKEHTYEKRLTYILNTLKKRG